AEIRERAPEVGRGYLAAQEGLGRELRSGHLEQLDLLTQAGVCVRADDVRDARVVERADARHGPPLSVILPLLEEQDLPGLKMEHAQEGATIDDRPGDGKALQP